MNVATVVPDVAAEQSLSTDVKELLDVFQERFLAKLTQVPPHRPIFHTIPLKDPDAQPPFRPAYRLSPLEQREVEKQITKHRSACQRLHRRKYPRLSKSTVSVY